MIIVLSNKGFVVHQEHVLLGGMEVDWIQALVFKVHLLTRLVVVLIGFSIF